MNIHILDAKFSGDPEASAMLQAFYSRSTESVVTRLERLGSDMTGVKKALSKFYVGYGHASIGDCGNVTVFIENVSIVAAKALQDDPRYNGQECSTRYIELDGEVYRPTPAVSYWLTAYKDVLASVLAGVRSEHEYVPEPGFDILKPEHTKPGSSYATWKNATQARAFDIARGWMPCAALTNLSISASLRVLQDITVELLGHPLPEVQRIAEALRVKLTEQYPSAVQYFTRQEHDRAEWLYKGGAHYITEAPFHGWRQGKHECYMDANVGDKTMHWINARPRHAKLPHHFESMGTVRIVGGIDYGTWRDLQRHRRNIGRPSRPHASNEIHPWYWEQLERYAGIKMTLASKIDAMQQLEIQLDSPESEEDQYDCPMGIIVPYEYTMGLSQALYFAELRSGNTVHDILRPIAQQVAETLVRYDIRVDYDNAPGRFDLRRGTQTITERD